jgi:hypothetical protein
MSTCDPQPHTITAVITNGSYYPFMAVSTHSLRLSFSRTNGLLPRAAVQVRRWRGRLILLRGRSERRRRLRRLVQISHLPDLNDEEGLPRLAADASPGNAWSIGYDVQSIPLRGEELIFYFPPRTGRRYHDQHPSRLIQDYTHDKYEEIAQI